MRPNKFNRAGLALFAVIVGVGIWWFTRPTAAPEKTAAAPLPAKIEAPKPLAPPQIAQPLAPPVQSTPKPVTASVADTSPPDPNDPQADLKTAIPDIVRLHLAGDSLALYETYVPPYKQDPKIIQQMQNLAERLARDPITNPQNLQLMKNITEGMAHSYEALETQTPTYNAAGDEATYMYTTPNLFGASVTEPKTFIKINGKWYEKPPEVQGTMSFSGPPGAH